MLVPVNFLVEQELMGLLVLPSVLMDGWDVVIDVGFLVGNGCWC